MKTTALLRNLIAEGKTQIVWKTLLVILTVFVGIYKETYFGKLKKQTLKCLNDIKITGYISGTL